MASPTHLSGMAMDPAAGMAAGPTALLHGDAMDGGDVGMGAVTPGVVAPPTADPGLAMYGMPLQHRVHQDLLMPSGLPAVPTLVHTQPGTQSAQAIGGVGGMPELQMARLPANPTHIKRKRDPTAGIPAAISMAMPLPADVITAAPAGIVVAGMQHMPAAKRAQPAPKAARTAPPPKQVPPQPQMMHPAMSPMSVAAAVAVARAYGALPAPPQAQAAPPPPPPAAAAPAPVTGAAGAPSVAPGAAAALGMSRAPMHLLQLKSLLHGNPRAALPPPMLAPPMNWGPQQPRQPMYAPPSAGAPGMYPPPSTAPQIFISAAVPPAAPQMQYAPQQSYMPSDLPPPLPVEATLIMPPAPPASAAVVPATRPQQYAQMPPVRSPGPPKAAPASAPAPATPVAPAPAPAATSPKADSTPLQDGVRRSSRQARPKKQESPPPSPKRKRTPKGAPLPPALPAAVVHAPDLDETEDGLAALMADTSAAVVTPAKKPAATPAKSGDKKSSTKPPVSASPQASSPMWPGATPQATKLGAVSTPVVSVPKPLPNVPYFCVYCHRPYKIEVTLLAHIESKHSEYGTLWTCDRCGEVHLVSTPKCWLCDRHVGHVIASQRSAPKLAT